MQGLIVFAAILAGATACETAVAADVDYRTEGAQKLSLANRNIFCGRAEEASRQYGIAVNAEITWRMAAGARTPAEALAAMRAEYCSQLARVGDIK